MQHFRSLCDSYTLKNIFIKLTIKAKKHNNNNNNKGKMIELWGKKCQIGGKISNISSFTQIFEGGGLMGCIISKYIPMEN